MAKRKICIWRAYEKCLPPKQIMQLEIKLNQNAPEQDKASRERKKQKKKRGEQNLWDNRMNEIRKIKKYEYEKKQKYNE